jgi:integrase
MRKFPQPFFRSARNLWYVQLNGRQINLGPDKEEAFQRYHALMGQAGSRNSDQSLTGFSVDAPLVLEIIESFLGWCQKHRAPRTYEWYVTKTSSFAKSIPRHLSVDQLKPFHVQDWVDSHAGWAPGQKRCCMTAVQRVFNWALKQGRIDVSPLRGLEKPEGGRRKVILTQAEFDKLIALVTAPDARDLLVVAWETGCRPQEICAVEKRHVDLEYARWVFPPEEAKGKRRSRVVYLTPPALAITQRLIARFPEGSLFRNSSRQPWNKHSAGCVFARIQILIGRENMQRKKIAVSETDVEALTADLRKRGKDQRNGKPLSDKELQGVARKRLSDKLAKKHGPKYCLYNFRHSFATRALESGLDAVTVAELMGHADTRMLARVYSHLFQRPTHLANALNQMSVA